MSLFGEYPRKVALTPGPNFLPGPNMFHSRAIATTKSGKVAMGSANSVCIFNAESSRFDSIWYLSHYAKSVRCSKSSELIMIAGDQSFTIVDDYKSAAVCLHHFVGIEGFKLTAADWSESQKFVIFGNDSGSIFVQKLDYLAQKPAEFNLLENDENQRNDSCVTCVEICPHAEYEKLVAVGFQNGNVCLFTWNDDKRYFRCEHSREIDCLAWSPKLEPNTIVGDETGRYLSDTILLASSGGDGYIRFWRINLTTDEAEGSVLTHCLLPPKDQRPTKPEKRFCPLLWPEQTPNQIISCSFGNELITVQLGQTPKSPRILNSAPWTYLDRWRDRPRSRPVSRKPTFGICLAGRSWKQVVVTHSYDSLIKVWNWSTEKEDRSFRSSSQMLNAACVRAGPNTTSSGWLLVSLHEKMFHLVGCEVSGYSPALLGEYCSNLFDAENSQITAIAADPKRPHTFAVGLSNGHVGIIRNLNRWDKPVFNPKGGIPYIKNYVSLLQYGPNFIESSAKPNELVYALICGKIFVYAPTKMDDTPLAFRSVLYCQDGSLSHDPQVYSFQWFLRSDLTSLLAVGYHHGVCGQFEQVLLKMQSGQSQIHFIYDELAELLLNFLCRFLPAEKLPKSSRQLLEDTIPHSKALLLGKCDVGLDTESPHDKVLRAASCIRIFKPMDRKLAYVLTLQMNSDDQVEHLAWNPWKPVLAAACESFMKSTPVKVFLLDNHDFTNARGTGRSDAVEPTTEVVPLDSGIAHICWLPPSKDHDLMLAIASRSKDYTIQIYDVLRKLPIGNYRGHGSHIRYIAPSPFNPEKVFSSSRDGCTFCWYWNKQPHKLPPGVVQEEGSCSSSVEGFSTSRSSGNSVAINELIASKDRQIAELQAEHSQCAGLGELVKGLQQQNAQLEKQVDDLSQIKACTLCLEEYSDVRYREALAPCGHSMFCRECVAKILADEQRSAIAAAIDSARRLGLPRPNTAKVPFFPKCPNCRDVFTAKQRIFID